MDEGYEIRLVFLDISKVFDKAVWHKGLVFKLKQNGISGNLLNIFGNFLRNRKQRVVLNGQISTLQNIHAGVSQGSILGPLLLLIYINGLAENPSSNPELFADYISLFFEVRDLIPLQLNLMTTWKKIKHRLINGKRATIRILWSRHKKSYSHGKEINSIILILFSTAIR